MTKKLLMVLCLMLAGISMYAQVAVSGKVSDENGPLPGAAVMVKGTTKEPLPT